MRTISQNAIEARKAARLSKADLSKRSGVSLYHISQIENPNYEHSTIPIGHLEAYAKGVGIHPAQFIFGETINRLAQDKYLLELTKLEQLRLQLK